MRRYKINGFRDVKPEDNILGWSREDFERVNAEMCQCRFQNNLPVHPAVLHSYMNTSDNTKYSYEEKGH